MYSIMYSIVKWLLAAKKQQNACDTSCFANIPDEIIAMIASYLQLKEIAKLMRVNKRFEGVIFNHANVLVPYVSLVRRANLSNPIPTSLRLSYPACRRIIKEFDKNIDTKTNEEEWLELKSNFRQALFRFGFHHAPKIGGIGIVLSLAIGFIVEDLNLAALGITGSMLISIYIMFVSATKIRAGEYSDQICQVRGEKKYLIKERSDFIFSRPK